MNRAASPLVFVVWLGLIGAQLSGLHMHVDAHGYSGAPHAAHSHSGGGDPHDHDHETDVTALDLGTVGSKQLMIFLLAVALSIALPILGARQILPRYVLLSAPGRRLRWRPPLRAPPRRS